MTKAEHGPWHVYDPGRATNQDKEWVMVCCNGCNVVTFHREVAAIKEFRNHLKLGHKAALFSPGILQIPGYRATVFQSDWKPKDPDNYFYVPIVKEQP